MLPALAKGRPTESVRARALALIERVGLKSRIQHFPSQLSGGERERVAVAVASAQAMLVLADEPTGNLDQASAETVCQVAAGNSSGRGSNADRRNTFDVVGKSDATMHGAEPWQFESRDGLTQLHGSICHVRRWQCSRRQ